METAWRPGCPVEDTSNASVPAVRSEGWTLEERIHKHSGNDGYHYLSIVALHTAVLTRRSKVCSSISLSLPY
jgi:hypothetical protein